MHNKKINLKCELKKLRAYKKAVRKMLIKLDTGIRIILTLSHANYYLRMDMSYVTTYFSQEKHSIPLLTITLMHLMHSLALLQYPHQALPSFIDVP